MTPKHSGLNEKSAAVFVDAMEEDTARLLVGDRSFVVPRDLLPDDAREGEWFRVRIDRTSPPDDGSPRRERLGKDDPGGPIKL